MTAKCYDNIPSAYILMKFGEINLVIYPVEINFNYMTDSYRHFFQLQKQHFIEITQIQSLSNIFMHDTLTLNIF